MVIVAIAFTWRYPLIGSDDQLTDIGKLAEYDAVEFFGYVGGLVVMFAAYIIGWREASRLDPERAVRAVWGCGLAMAGAFALMYPVNAIDLFIYAVRSRLWTEHGVNPMAAFPNDYPNDPLMRFASREWADDVSPYGPLWNWIAAPATGLAGDNLLTALLLFKLIALLSFLGVGWLLARTVSVDRPEAAAASSLFFLWNPLVLWEGVGNGHNDVVLALALVLALMSWARRYDRLAIPWLVIAALVKYVGVVLLPLMVVALWRRHRETRARLDVALSSLAISAVVIIYAFAPFFDLDAVVDSVRSQGDIFLTSPAALAVTELRNDFALEDIKWWSRLIGQTIVFGAIVWWLPRLWRQPARLPRAAFEVMFLFLLVATPNFRVWYLIWLVALAAIVPAGWPAWRAIAWTAGGLAGYGLFIWGWEWWKAPFADVQLAGVAMMTGPVVVLTLAEAVIHLRRRRRADETACLGDEGIPRSDVANGLSAARD